MPRDWQVGKYKPPRPPPAPRAPLAPSNHHGLHSNLSPSARHPTPTQLSQHDQALNEENLRQSLLQAQARIELQAQALQDAANDAQRAHESSARAEALSHRCEALEAELRVMRRQLGESRRAVVGRDESWSHHHSLEEEIAERATAEKESKAAYVAQVNQLRADLLESQERTARTAEALQDARTQAERWRVGLEQSQEKARALDARCVAQAAEMEDMRLMATKMRSTQRDWKRERAGLLNEVDRNTTSAILRREELHFTRTSLLKETLRLRGELERKPLPLPEPEEPDAHRPVKSGFANPRSAAAAVPAGRAAGASPPLQPQQKAPAAASIAQPSGWVSRAWEEVSHEAQSAAAPAGSVYYRAPTADALGLREHAETEPRITIPTAPPTPQERLKIDAPESPRERRLHTPSHRPAGPAPPTFVHGLVPRAPRSLDNASEFEEQLLSEFRAASRAAAVFGRSSPPHAILGQPRHEQLMRNGERVVRVADAVGVRTPSPPF